MAIDRIRDLRRFTGARIALDRAGHSLATTEWLALREAHAAARDAVHAVLAPLVLPCPSVNVRSRCATRTEYLERPDLGRLLHPDDAGLIPQGPFDLALILADGLSPVAVAHHAAVVVQHLDLAGITISPAIVVSQGRVAIGDDIGERMKARAVLVLIGERPGLSAADSLGAYLTFEPRIGRTDAERNCVSNIRVAGLDPGSAAVRISWLVRESLRRSLSGVNLKMNMPSRLS